MISGCHHTFFLQPERVLKMGKGEKPAALDDCDEQGVKTVDEKKLNKEQSLNNINNKEKPNHHL